MRRRAATDYVEDGIISPKLFKPEPFRTIVADPPWPYGDKLPGKGRGAVKNYRTMKVDAIARYLESYDMRNEVAEAVGKWPGIAKDARLFLWRVAPMQDEAIHVLRAWGFGAPVSELVWCKTTQNETGLRNVLHTMLAVALRKGSDHVATFLNEAIARARRLDFGMGRTFRMSHETCLVGRRGRPERKSASERSVLFAPGGKHAAEHSQKPEEFFELVERLSPGPYLELFAGGHRRPGWTCLGDAHRVEADGE